MLFWNRARSALFVTLLFFTAYQADAGDFRVEVVSKGFQHDFWRQVNRGCDQAGKDFDADINFVGPESESGIAEQITLLAEALKRNPDAMCVAAISPEPALVELVFSAVEAGIPVITFDSDIGIDMGSDVQAFVATDNMDAGAGATDKMYEALSVRKSRPSQPIRIGVFSQDLMSQSIGDRTFGFIERIKHLYGAGNVAVEGAELYRMPNPNASVILEVAIPPKTVSEAMDQVVRSVLSKPDLVGAYGSNEFSAKSMVTVNAELNVLGPDKAVGIGFDSGADQVRAVRDRVFLGSITQNPFMIGYLSVKTAIEAVKGMPVDDTAVPFFFYTADNLDEPDIAACLYD
ncbi:MAG: substrate-binding domain-containing protein [Planctomycetes bacterium]|nr:substrate-binding domain-containing protein [Planctomycetota bacterium]